MKKTCLMVDDMVLNKFRPDEVTAHFANAGVSAVLSRALTVDHGLEVLRRWQDQGLGLDILIVDLEAGRGNAGIADIERIVEYIRRRRL